MKFESKQAYVASFKVRIATVSGRSMVEREIEEDIQKFIALIPKVDASIAKRNMTAARLISEKKRLLDDRKSYVLSSLIGILKPSVVKRVKVIDAELDVLAARRSRLLGNELKLDECRALLNDLLDATKTFIEQIRHQQQLHEWNLDFQKKKRAADRHGREKQLAPYTKRIELGIAAMGKTRAVASVRKRKLEKSAECPYCGKPFGPDAGVADHIHPVARGGLSVVENLVYVCTPCNQKKSDRTLNEYICPLGRKLIKLLGI